MKTNNNPVGLPGVEKPTLFDQIKETLAVASQFIITAPLKLPPTVVTVAKYVALAVGVLDALESGLREKEGENDENG